MGNHLWTEDPLRQYQGNANLNNELTLQACSTGQNFGTLTPNASEYLEQQNLLFFAGGNQTGAAALRNLGSLQK